jgi:hypothetical protein
MHGETNIKNWLQVYILGISELVKNSPNPPHPLPA